MKTYVIVGGVAGGAGTAARLRRLDEDSTIIIYERGNTSVLQTVVFLTMSEELLVIVKISLLLLLNTLSRCLTLK